MVSSFPGVASAAAAPDHTVSNTIRRFYINCQNVKNAPDDDWWIVSSVLSHLSALKSISTDENQLA